MLLRLPQTSARRQTSRSAAAHSLPVDAPPWPRRPDASALNKSIPLFYISRDYDGLWVACAADFRIGGVFLSQRSALRFAQRCSEPARCATMILDEPHNLDIENRGNRFADLLRPPIRLIKSIVLKIRSIGAGLSRAYIEERVLHAALEVELYRGRYKHSNKNDDDLPIVTEIRMLKNANNEPAGATGVRGALPVIIAFAIFAIVLTAIIALRVAIWLPKFQH